MKIIYHHRIASKDGQYVHLSEMVEALKKENHEVILVGPKILEKNKFGSNGGFISLLKQYMPKSLYEVIEISYSLIAFCKLFIAVIINRPDCLYERCNLFLPSGIWIKKLFKLPMLLEINAPLYEERSAHDGMAFGLLARNIEYYTWRNADITLPVTKVLADKVASAGVPKERIKVIPNAINLNEFNKTLDYNEARKKLGVSNYLVLGFVGFMRDWHGLERVLEYIKENKRTDLFFLIAGDGPARENLTSYARKLGIEDRLLITGVIGRKEVGNYISAFDIALQPNVVPYASPLKIYEYMVLEKPIIAPATPNIMEILDNNKNALLFSQDDDCSFKLALDTLCNDKKLCTQLAKSAKQKILGADINWRNNAKIVVETFNSLIESTK